MDDGTSADIDRDVLTSRVGPSRAEDRTNMVQDAGIERPAGGAAAFDVSTVPGHPRPHHARSGSSPKYVVKKSFPTPNYEEVFAECFTLAPPQPPMTTNRQHRPSHPFDHDHVQRRRV
jgi:hypothetical protein